MFYLQEIVYYLTIKPRLYRLQKLLPEAKIHPCGSRYVCNPPVMNTDIDFLVYCKDNLLVKLGTAGYTITSLFPQYHNPDHQFVSYRKGKVNLIVTCSAKFADSHNLATHIVKAKNLRIKWDRVFVYEHLRGNVCDNTSTINIDEETKQLLVNLSGPYAIAMRAMYRLKHGLGKPWS